MSGLLEELTLGDVRRVHELVAGLLVANPAVVLHEPAHDAALGMEHGQARTDLFGEREQIELDAELAVVALLGFFEAMQVGGEGLVVLPRRAVDALQHRLRLVAPPVRAGDLLQLEAAEPTRRGYVRAATEVDEAVGVAVGAHHVAAGHFAGVDPLDDLAFVRLVGEDLEALVDRALVADERLVLGDDLAHPTFDPFEVVVAEGGPVGQREVVVEAVLDGGADRELRTREQIEHRLREHVSRAVAEYLAPLIRRGRHDAHFGAIGQRAVQVSQFAVDVDDQSVLGQSLADRRRQIGPGRRLGQGLR